MNEPSKQVPKDEAKEVEQNPDLASRRREFEHRVGDVRHAFDRDFGWTPRTARWVFPTMAAAAGFGAALWLRALAAGDRQKRRELKA